MSLRPSVPRLRSARMLTIPIPARKAVRKLLFTVFVSSSLPEKNRFLMTIKIYVSMLIRAINKAINQAVTPPGPRVLGVVVKSNTNTKTVPTTAAIAKPVFLMWTVFIFMPILVTIGYYPR